MTTYDEHLDAAVKAAQDAARAAQTGGGGGGGTITSVNGQTGPAVTLTASSVGAVPTTRTVNGKALSADIALTNTDVGAAATSHTHPASQISDSTTTGRALLTAADAATARAAIGAGTSSLAIGTTGTTAAAGNDSRLSDSRTPTGTAGGDLSGTYPNPSVAKVAGVTITGTPASGKTIIATSGTAASWQTPSGGGGGTSLDPSGLWTFPGVAINANDNQAYPMGSNVLGQFEGQMMQLDQARTLSGLAMHILTASGSAGSTATLCVYSVPTPLTSATPTATLVLNAGTVATDSTGFKAITGLSQALAAGNYLVGFVATVAFTPYRLGGPRLRWINQSSDFTSSNQIGYYWKGTVSGNPASLAVDGTFKRPNALCPVMVQL